MRRNKSGGSNRMRKVLIIDDNIADSTLMADNIKTHNDAVDVKVVNTSVEAKNAFQEYSPNVAFVDINMPGMDGFELLNEINALPQRDNSLVIVCSGYSDVGTLDMAMKLGADNYFVKPADNNGYKRLANIISNDVELREYKAL